MCGSYTGIMESLIVYMQGTSVIIGSGQRIYYNNKEGETRTQITLINLKGEELEAGFYTILPQNSKLVIVNRTVQ